MSAMPQNVIDLTNDSPQPRPNFATTALSSRLSRAPQAAPDVIDVDDLDSNHATVNSSPNGSPDLELLEVRSVRSEQQAISGSTRQRRVERARLAHPSTPAHGHHRSSVGPWGAIQDYAQRFNRPYIRRPIDGSNAAGRFMQMARDEPHQDILRIHGRNIILPGDLDFVTQGFRMGEMTAGALQPPQPTYDAPSPPRHGYTRTPKANDVLICPNCEEELGTGQDEAKRQVWVIRACGHV